MSVDFRAGLDWSPQCIDRKTDERKARQESELSDPHAFTRWPFGYFQRTARHPKNKLQTALLGIIHDCLYALRVK